MRKTLPADHIRTTTHRPRPSSYQHSTHCLTNQGFPTPTLQVPCQGRRLHAKLSEYPTLLRLLRLHAYHVTDQHARHVIGRTTRSSRDITPPLRVELLRD